MEQPKEMNENLRAEEEDFSEQEEEIIPPVDLNKIKQIRCTCGKYNHQLIGLVESNFLLRCADCGIIQMIGFMSNQTKLQERKISYLG